MWEKYFVNLFLPIFITLAFATFIGKSLTLHFPAVNENSTFIRKILLFNICQSSVHVINHPLILHLQSSLIWVSWKLIPGLDPQPKFFYKILIKFHKLLLFENWSYLNTKNMQYYNLYLPYLFLLIFDIHFVYTQQQRRNGKKEERRQWSGLQIVCGNHASIFMTSV